MDDIHKHKNMDELRRRLYARDVVSAPNERHGLTDQKVDVSRNWQTGPVTTAPARVVPTPLAPVSENTPPSSVPTTTPEVQAEVKQKPKRHYRSFLLIGSLLIFIFGAGLAALYLMFGGTAISSDNIALSIAGPTALGGGETMSLQVGITNQNTVAIEAATLVVKYPAGARSVNESERNLYEERIPINAIAPGEVRNIPIRVTVFGEEGEEKLVNATIEYRIEGSNGTFYKDASPLAFRITSTPLVLRVENLEKVASGQQVDVKLVVQSNSSNPIKNLLIRAEFPNGFDYVKAVPEPVFGENVWRIPELGQEESVEIVIKGVVTGVTEESQRINFLAGPAESDNQYVMASKIAEGRADFTIEQPFIDVDIAINGKTDNPVLLGANERTQVNIDITNTLDETVYDLVVEVSPGGNALGADSIEAEYGFYDSNTGIIRWEVSNNANFMQLFPGETRRASFQITPQSDVGTASFNLVANIYARRVAEQNAEGQLVGSVSAEAKYSSSIKLGSQANLVSGPVPPTVGQQTSYEISLVAEAGTNDVTDAIITTALPVHVNWLNDYSGAGSLTYNSVSKQIEWKAGDVEVNQRKEMVFKVSILPSASQSGTTPILVNGQQMRAKDRFTGALLQASAAAITTELSTEAGYGVNNGRVTE